MTKLTAELRALLMNELRAREQFTIKAIARRNGVSRQTLARLRAEMLKQGGPAGDASQNVPMVKMTQSAH